MASVLPVPIRQALDAANAGDAASFAACFRPRRGCIDDWGRKHHGDRDVRRWGERELIDKRAHIKVIHFYLLGDGGGATVIAHVDRSDFHGPATFNFYLRDEYIDVLAITA